LNGQISPLSVALTLAREKVMQSQTSLIKMENQLTTLLKEFEL